MMSPKTPVMSTVSQPTQRQTPFCHDENQTLLPSMHTLAKTCKRKLMASRHYRPSHTHRSAPPKGLQHRTNTRHHRHRPGSQSAPDHGPYNGAPRSTLHTTPGYNRRTKEYATSRSEWHTTHILRRDHSYNDHKEECKTSEATANHPHKKAE